MFGRPGAALGIVAGSVTVLDTARRGMLTPFMKAAQYSGSVVGPCIATMYVIPVPVLQQVEVRGGLRPQRDRGEGGGANGTEPTYQMHIYRVGVASRDDEPLTQYVVLPEIGTPGGG
jgi:hypothetical protein